MGGKYINNIKATTQYLVSVNTVTLYIEIEKIFLKIFRRSAKKIRPCPIYYMETQAGQVYLEKWRIAHNPTPAVIQERRIVCIMRAHRITSAQRGLEIRGLNKSAGSGPG